MQPPTTRVAAALLMAALTTACVELNYTPVPVDSPPLTRKPVACRTLMPTDKALKTDAVGVVGAAPSSATTATGAASAPQANTCDVLVRAEDWTTDTGLRVQANEGWQYCIDVMPGQVWFDKSSRANPPAALAPDGIREAAEKMGLTRHQGIGYMALMAGVATDPSVRDASHVQAIDKQGGRCLKPRGSGTLVLYPNDAVSRGPDPQHFYRNNLGQIWVRITREVDAGPQAPGAPRSAGRP